MIVILYVLNAKKDLNIKIIFIIIAICNQFICNNFQCKICHISKCEDTSVEYEYDQYDEDEFKNDYLDFIHYLVQEIIID